jgi:DNA-binding PadR family transcriptional regulator
MPAEADTPKNITPRIAVLSLVVQEPDTAAGVSRRLKEQFPAAQFPESSAHNNMRSLAATGHIRLVEEGTEPPLNRYEATAAGDELSRQWVLRSSLPPMMRDPLQGKLAFVGYKQIAALIQLVREEDRAFRIEYDQVQSRWLSHKRFRDDLAGIDWHAELQAIKLKDEVDLFGVMVIRRKKVRRELEELLLRLDDD